MRHFPIPHVWRFARRRALPYFVAWSHLAYCARFSYLGSSCLAPRAVLGIIKSFASREFLLRTPSPTRHCRALKAALSCSHSSAWRAAVLTSHSSGRLRRRLTPALGLMKFSGKEILLLLLGLLPAIIVVFVAFVFVPGCIAFYAPVSSQLSPQARFVFSFYYLCVGLPIFVVGVWWFYRKRLHGGFAAASFGIVGSIAICVFGCWAIYQPQLILALMQRHGS